MTMTWAAFESALSGHRDPAGALDALTTSSMEDVQAMLDGIGAGEAGRLLKEALAAESPARLSKLAASLEIIDRHLSAGSMRRADVFPWRRVWVGEAPTASSKRPALLASLIDAASGGDPEGLRTRMVAVTTGWEAVIIPDLKGLSKADFEAEITAARRALQRVLQLLLAEMENRPEGAANG
jgi:hypothetical protein